MKRLLAILTILLVVGVGAAGAHDAQTGLVRLVNLPFDGKAANLYVDGVAATNSDGSTTLVSAAGVSLYSAYPAGKHTLTVAADGQDMKTPLVDPVDATVEAGHRYTLAILGSADSMKTEWIDETAGFESAGIDPASSPQLFINNLKGSPALDISLDGKSLGLRVGYGEHAFTVIPPANYSTLAITAADDPKTAPFPPQPIFFEPTVAYVASLTGDFSGGTDTFGKAYNLIYSEYSPRNLADFLKGFSGLKLGFAAFPSEVELPFQKQTFSFDTALKAFDAAGLSTILTGSDVHTVFIPTDDAFAALPSGTLDALMADPAKLRNVLLYHVADGRVGFDQLAAQGSIKTQQGGDLKVAMSGEGALNINGDEAGCGCNYDAANGHVYILDHVLMPKS